MTVFDGELDGEPVRVFMDVNSDVLENQHTYILKAVRPATGEIIGREALSGRELARLALGKMKLTMSGGLFE